MFQPLKGVRVVDLSQVLAGPYATYQLALMGAEVIKIEKPGEGDWTRTGGPLPDLSERRMGLGYLTQNAAKKSVTINLKTPEGLELARKLVATADVFVENFKPGVAARLGLGFEAVRGIRKDIVYCSISAYGQNGPLSRRPAYDHVIQGMCGIMLTTGKPGDGPTKVGAPYVDFATGMNAAMAVMAGLMEARRTGAAVELDVAMLDTALMLMASMMTQHKTAHWMPVQNGNEAWSTSPSSGAFETADGMLMLAANNEPQFRKLCTAIGREDILADARWRSPEARRTHGPELREALNATFLARTAADWETILETADVPAARVRGLDEALAEPQIAARQLLSEIRVEGHDGAIHVPSLSFMADGLAVAPQSSAPRLGEDTDSVMRELGIDAEQLDRLRASNVI
ncbi:crotonobetainyl-CoA:carnitine CoA-transferase CaiB-like acyl-CoA transferase [Hoeflea marina]|uniref:Crotonobetainyl-CoA:carnitine CoA-transferase CaiB-like acyl-CoA transferase n=1 Tax=Hoeflea marina TaxID=274592 RepID=A0A317PL09_9HYPH|nr:CoA transferase [Hoeflea marina]PWW01486.1 crotonobetainyl-CoA:carnitine CoA-transferase CaiB-like acyl-CoA transferase [Hoeflea marina]